MTCHNRSRFERIRVSQTILVLEIFKWISDVLRDTIVGAPGRTLDWCHDVLTRAKKGLPLIFEYS